MPIRIRAAHRQLLQACTRPATTARFIKFPSASVPPRRQTLRTMTSSASSVRPATTQVLATSPAPAASTSPLPGNTPSASPAGPAAAAAAAAADSSGPGGAAPAESQSHRSHQQPTVTDGTSTPDGAIPTTTSTSTSPPNLDNTHNNDTQQQQPKPLPALPAPDSLPLSESQGLRTVHVNGQPIALDNLGPMVIGRDGTVSRIANWHEMTDIERQNTLRILCKRNQLRLGNLRAGLPADYKPDCEGSGSGSSGQPSS